MLLTAGVRSLSILVNEGVAEFHTRGAERVYPIVGGECLEGLRREHVEQYRLCVNFHFLTPRESNGTNVTD